jgi:lipid-binding SYLF domain-containing protein
MNKTLGSAVILGAALLILPACTTAPKSDSARADLDNSVAQAMADFRRADPDIQKFLDTAYGYAIFPSVGKGAAGVGGAFGHGEVFEQGRKIGYCSLSQATIGFQLGGQAYSELIVFENKAALDRFTSGSFAFAAQASAVALKAGASTNAKYANGVAVFTVTKGGLMYEASVGGQKFSFEPL